LKRWTVIVWNTLPENTVKTPPTITNHALRDLMSLSAVLTAILPIFLFCSSPVNSESVAITLEDGLQMAFARNEVLRAARGDVDRAHTFVREAIGDGLPQIRAAATFNRNWKLPTSVLDGADGPTRVTFGTRNNLNSSLTLRQSLYAGGGVAAEWRQSKHFERASRETLREIRQAVHAEVETAYYDLLLAAELVRVSDLALDRARRNFKQVQLLRQAGRASRFDLLRAEVQVLELRPDSIRASRDLKVANITFKNLIGLDITDGLTLSDDFRETASLALTDPVALTKQSFESRPDRRRQSHRVAARRQSIKIQQAGRMPTLDFVATGQMQVQSNEFDFTSDDIRRSWFTGLDLRFPIFDGLKTRASISRARIDLKRTELETENLEREIRLEIHTAWLIFQETIDQLDAQARATELTAEGLRAAEAQLSLLRAETEHARAKRDRAVAIVELERSVGLLGEQ
jgi:outer membrane protein TolC